MNNLKHLTAAALFVLGIGIFSSSTHACTGIKVISEDGTVIFARTAEFGIDLDIRPIGIPAGVEFVGSAPGNKAGLTWISKYAAIGTNTLGMPYITTGGLNEKGLYVGAFNHAQFAVYQDVTPADYDKTLNCFQLSNYLLTTTGMSTFVVTNNYARNINFVNYG